MFDLIEWLSNVRPGMYRSVENMGVHDGSHSIQLKVYYRTSIPTIISEGRGPTFQDALSAAVENMHVLNS